MAIFSTILALIMACFSGTPVFADSAENSIHMQLSPTSERITLEPNSTYTNKFMLRNIGDTDFHYSIGISPYQVTDDSYLPSYNINNTHTQIVDWVTFSQDSGVLAPNESVYITYTINVPEDVPAGGQYAVLTAETSDGNISGTSVRTISRIGMVLYATVSGVTRTSGNIVDAKINGFIFNNKLFTSSTVINTGNVDSEADYYIEVRNLFTNQIAYSTKAEPTTKIVLPGTTRTNIITWENSPSLGLFRVEQNVDFLGKNSNISKIVFLCPTWLLISLIGFLALIVIWIIIKVRTKRERKKSGKFGL